MCALPITKVGINGFGRIGRQVVRTIQERHPEELEVVAVNDLTDTPTNAHLLKYDSSYGRFPGRVETGDGALIINGRSIRVFAARAPAALPWGEGGAQIGLQSTGRV